MTGYDRRTAKMCPANAHNFGSRRGASIDAIVIHTMEGTLAGTCNRFADPDAQCSAHYGIGRNAELVQYVDESFAAWHSGNGPMNRRSIGIELEAFAAQAESFTEPMMSSLVWLIADLRDDYLFPIDREHVIGHHEVPDLRHPGMFGGVNHHYDPGPHFPWGRVIHDLGELLAGA